MVAMVGRSLVASDDGILKAKQVLQDRSLTQKGLADLLECRRAVVNKFFNQRPIDRNNFCNICEELNFDWEDIVENPPQYELPTIEIDALVQQVREDVREDIQACCGTMRILDMSQPIGLSDIYTDVNILEKITGRSRKGIEDLLAGCNVGEDFYRWGLGKIREERVPGLQAVQDYPKLLILGKPGAGKTTFLKFIAISCLEGEFCAGCAPFFVTLKDFAETRDRPELFDYLARFLSGSGRDRQLQKILDHHRALVLLDGLDEVREDDSPRVIKAIRDFTHHYRQNRTILTCRIAAREYTFQAFTEVEIADFDDEQIATFARNWFKHKVVKAEDFLERLEQQEAVKELATNPLLLTLLCLVFEEAGDFSANRAELYEEGVDALLKKWDAKRGIQRDNPYQKLSVGRKEDLLSRLAWRTFVAGDYFFKQGRAEREIAEYIRNLPGAAADEEALQLDSETVLRAIEAQHGLLVARAKGIYSFSHLTFQEYFVAREIVTVRQSAELALQELMAHLTEPRWWEVFLLAAAMSPQADRLLLLMKERADALVAGDEKIQRWLQWGIEKARSVEVDYTPELVERVSKGLGFAIDIDLSRTRSFYLNLDLNLNIDLYVSLAVSPYVSVSPYLSLNLDLDLSLNLNIDFDLSLKAARELDPALHTELKPLFARLPDLDNKAEFKEWWNANGAAWQEDLRKVAIEYRNIGHDWQFSKEQKALLQEYWNANKLLMQCLNSECYVSRETRQKIEEMLFLPIAFQPDSP